MSSIPSVLPYVHVNISYARHSHSPTPFTCSVLIGYSRCVVRVSCDLPADPCLSTVSSVSCPSGPFVSSVRIVLSRDPSDVPVRIVPTSPRPSHLPVRIVRSYRPSPSLSVVGPSVSDPTLRFGLVRAQSGLPPHRAGRLSLACCPSQPVLRRTGPVRGGSGQRERVGHARRLITCRLHPPQTCARTAPRPPEGTAAPGR